MKAQEFVETVKEATRDVIKNDPQSWEYLVPNVWEHTTPDFEPEKDIIDFFAKSDDGAPMGFLEEYLYDYKKTLETDNGVVRLEKVFREDSQIVRVFSITNLDDSKQYFIIKGYCSSWDEETNYIGCSFVEVVPQEKTVIEYVPR